MSTSISTIKQNVKTTPKAREPSKERIKSKKDEIQANTKTSKTVPTPSSNRLSKNATTSVSKLKKQASTSLASTRLSKTEEKTGPKLKKSTSVPNSVDRLKKTETDSARKLKTTTIKNKDEGSNSNRSKNGVTKVSSSVKSKDDESRSSNRKVPLKDATGKLKISSRRPGSPSSRIKKSQFIPNTKEMYSNALKNVPKESNSENSSACSTLERPRTATLRKGSIVNMNIAGPDVPKTSDKSVKKKSSSHTLKGGENKNDNNNSYEDLSKSETHISKDTTDRLSKLNPDDINTIKTGIDDIIRSKTPNPDEYDYEEDFDSYASDFDEYQSSSETSNYSINTSPESSDVSTSSSTSGGETKPRINSAEEERKLDSGNFDLPETKHKPILGNITEQKEMITHGSLSDEGFEEIKSLQFVNFLGAKKKRELQRSQSRRNKRGEELLGMIRLDQRNFTLIDIPPVTYDTYIKSFGNRNSTQVTTQTHDDDISEETQTEEIAMDNKWTQYPIKYPKINNAKDLICMNHKGVGTDKPEDLQSPKYNEYNLAEFLRNSGQVILALLQEQTTKEIIANTTQQSTEDLSFCDSGVCLSSDFLQPRSVSFLGFSTGGLLKLVSVHPPVSKGGKDCNLGGDYRLKSVGCVWEPSDVTFPEDVFAGFGIVNAVCFAATNNKMIFGGLDDGTVTLWDLLEGRTEGGDYVELDSRNSKRQVRMTTTAKCTTEPDLENGSARIVAVQSIGNTHKDFDVLRTNLQVLTLNEIGNLTIWGLIIHGTHNVASLVRYSTFSLESINPELTDLQCTDMCIDQIDSNHVYVATNYGYTLHCLLNGSKTNPKKYSPESACKANSIEACHHQKDCFLVGFEDGNVSLYSSSVEKPLASFSNQDVEEAPVKTVQWSRNRPWIFYTIDSDKTIHVWDLSQSEHFPAHSVPFAKGVKSIKLSEPSNINNKRSYLAIVAKDEYIHLHQLTGDHSRKSAEDYTKDLKVFTNYINRL